MQKREVEYDKYQRDKMSIAKNEFRSLLKETKIISHKSLEMVKESGRHFKDIIDVLKVREKKRNSSFKQYSKMTFFRMTSGFWCWTVLLVKERIFSMLT